MIGIASVTVHLGRPLPVFSLTDGDGDLHERQRTSANPCRKEKLEEVQEMRSLRIALYFTVLVMLAGKTVRAGGRNRHYPRDRDGHVRCHHLQRQGNGHQHCNQCRFQNSDQFCWRLQRSISEPRSIQGHRRSAGISKIRHQRHRPHRKPEGSRRRPAQAWRRYRDGGSIGAGGGARTPTAQSLPT